MFESRKWQKFALFLNLLGSVVLFLSFQATSSNIKIVTTKDGLETALCVEGKAMIVARSTGYSIGMMGKSCPEWENARPAAIVNIEKPFLVTIGFAMIVLGFLVQLFSVPDTATIEQIRKDRKALKSRKHSQ